jgi:Lysylphosphatidylglycerol synthase TM region
MISDAVETRPFAGPGARVRNAAISFVSYGSAIAIVWWLARGIPIAQLVHALARANLTLFIPAAAASIALWMLSDTIMYVRVFSDFHTPTGFREMLPGTATHEFLQVANGVAAGTVLAWFVHIRKHINWLAAGCTLALLGFIDMQVIAWMLLVGARLEPRATFGIAWYYPAVFILGSCVFVGFWMRGRPRSGITRWLYERQFFTAFRQARTRHYIALGAIRAPFFLVQGIVLWAELIAFGIRVPLLFAMATLPVVLIAGALPFAPSGLGTRQAAIVFGFREFGSRSALLTMSLAHSWIVIAIRLVLGLVVGTAVLRSVLTSSFDALPPLASEERAG